MPVENPATGQMIAEVVDASAEDVDRAVQAAKAAFYDGCWSRLVPSERSKAIWKLADLLEKQAEEFARLESQNTSKPLTSEAPHGGFKQSGFSKDLSAEAVGDYLITKHVMIGQV